MNDTPTHPPGFDPILVEVVKNELAAITEEMAIAVWKTGRSAMVKTGDFATALCDGKGRVIGQGYAAPFQIAFFMDTMACLLAKYEGSFRPGDVIVMNDPYAGVTHMPDVVVIVPAFWREQLVAYAVSYSHHTDIGGRFPGGLSSQCGETFEEGLRLPILKLYEAGVLNLPLRDTILANVRMGEEWLGDLDAKIAGCRRGEQELANLLEKYGLETLDATVDYLIDYSERATRRAVAEVPHGEYLHEDIFEDDGFGTEGTAFPLKLTMRADGERLVFDLTGTAPQAAGAINLPECMTKATVLDAIKGIVGPDVLINEGLARPIEIILPEGSLVNPRFPAAVGGRAPLFFRVMDMLARVLAQALPEKLPIPGEGGDVLHFTGRRDDGGEFALMDIFFGGWGGRPRQDGIDGIAPISFGSYGTVPAELMEREYPVVVDGFGYVPDSGGPGRYRGSLSIYKTWRFRRPGKVMIRTNRLVRPNDGMAGGGPGGLSNNELRAGDETTELPKSAHYHLDVEPGEALHHVIAGAGGHGDPLQRDPERVRDDVRDEKLSITAAAADYGVVLDPETLQIDWPATAARRGETGD